MQCLSDYRPPFYPAPHPSLTDTIVTDIRQQRRCHACGNRLSAAKGTCQGHLPQGRAEGRAEGCWGLLSLVVAQERVPNQGRGKKQRGPGRVAMGAGRSLSPGNRKRPGKQDYCSYPGLVHDHGNEQAVITGTMQGIMHESVSLQH